jgi:hypothetical protein
MSLFFAVSFSDFSKYTRGIINQASNNQYQPGNLYSENIFVNISFVYGILNKLISKMNIATIPKTAYLFLKGRNNNNNGSNAK